MRDTSHTGEVSRTQGVAALTLLGKHLLAPLGDFRRSDLAIDEGDRFLRVQCKTGRLINGAIVFYPYSVDSRSEKGRCIRRGIGGKWSYSASTARTMGNVTWCRWRRRRLVAVASGSRRRKTARRPKSDGLTSSRSVLGFRSRSGFPKWGGGRCRSVPARPPQIRRKSMELAGFEPATS